MTPGQVVLSDRGVWLKIADVLRQVGPSWRSVKAGRFSSGGGPGGGGSDEDAPVTVIFEVRQGFAHTAVVRAGRQVAA